MFWVLGGLAGLTQVGKSRVGMTERPDDQPVVLGARLPPVERLVNLTEHAIMVDSLTTSSDEEDGAPAAAVRLGHRPASGRARFRGNVPRNCVRGLRRVGWPHLACGRE